MLHPLPSPPLSVHVLAPSVCANSPICSCLWIWALHFSLKEICAVWWPLMTSANQRVRWESCRTTSGHNFKSGYWTTNGLKRNSFKHQFSTQTVLSRDVVRCVKIENDFKWFIWFYRILFPQEEVINSEPTIFMHLDFYSKLSSSGGRPGSSESDGLLKLCSHPQESRSASLEKHTNQIWKQAQEQFKTSTQTH